MGKLRWMGAPLDTGEGTAKGREMTRMDAKMDGELRGMWGSAGSGNGTTEYTEDTEGCSAGCELRGMCEWNREMKRMGRENG